MKRLGLVLCALAAAAFAPGCDVSSSGAEGVLLFTPTDCGRIGCDFDDSVGVGGAIFVHISPNEAGVSTVGLDLASSDPSVFTVDVAPDVGGEPTWELIGQNPGVADLAAIDVASGDEVDFLEVDVQELTALASRNIIGDAVGPDTADPDFDEVWIINADQRVTFQIEPLIGDGFVTMGRYLYTPAIDAAIDDGLNDVDGLADGRLDFQVPAGQHAASFTDDFGHSIDILFDAQ